ncbi:hypothetical protein JCM8097_003003 [Rhodosporidiobolus ruineniae]
MDTGDPFALPDGFSSAWDATADPLSSSSLHFDASLDNIFGNPADPFSSFTVDQEDAAPPAGASELSLEELLAGGLNSGAIVEQQRRSISEGQSPLSQSTYTSSTSHPDSSFTSTAPTDLDSLLSSLSSSSPDQQPSPAFSFTHVEHLASNLPKEFDTAALQSLFSDSPPAVPSSSASLSPFSATGQGQGQLFQTASPAPTTTSTSPFSPSLNAFPTALSPAAIFSSSTSSSSASPPGLTAPRLSFSSTTSTPDASAQQPPLTFSAFQAQHQQQTGRTRSLAATAGVTVPPLLLQPSSHPSQGFANEPRAGQFSFTLSQDPSAGLPLSLLQSQAAQAHHQARTALPATVQYGLPALPTQQQQQLQQGVSTRRQRSAVEVIANAGMQPGGAVYQAPLLQLRPNVTFTSAADEPAPVPASAKPTRTKAAAKEEKEDVPPVSAPAGKGGKRGKGKKNDRGHNAVEQKYRNSINDALASLRDAIPALQHLKPLPDMPVTKRKASQFTLASAAVPAAPTGLVDGVPAAKTLSKGVILGKASEYIDYLRFRRDAQLEDLELLKTLVCEMVAGGEAVVEEFERRQKREEVRREAERASARDDGESGEDEAAEEDDDEDSTAHLPPVPAPTAAKSTSRKRGQPSSSSLAGLGASAPQQPATKKTRLASQHLSPALTSDYRHVQALNQAHLEALAAAQQGQQQGAFPPSPVSSAEGDAAGVSPSAIMGGSSGSPPRVLLASFMGLSFAGGMGLDFASSAATAEEAVAGAAARAWTGRLVRRSVSGSSDVGGASALLPPAVVGGLVTLGLASIVAAVVYLVWPLFAPTSSSTSRRSRPSTSKKDRRRADALAALAALNAPLSSLEDQPVPATVGSVRAHALKARKALLRLVGAPSTLNLPSGVLKEAVVAALREYAGVAVGGKKGNEVERREEAAAWVRVAEIEASYGDRVPTLSRIYTFLRLLNLSRSSSWPSPAPSPSAAPSAVTAVLSIHLLALGHPRWAESLWTSMQAQQKKADSSTSVNDSKEGFTDLALSSDFSTVLALLDPSSRLLKADDAPPQPSDGVPLLVLAEAACEDALAQAWGKMFVAVVGSTTAPGQEGEKEQLDAAEVGETLDGVLAALDAVEGSETRAMAALSRVFLTCFVAGTGSSTDKDKDEGRALFTRLAVEYRNSPSSSAFGRLAAAKPFLQLFLPVFAPSVPFPSLLPSSAADHITVVPTSEPDLLATAVLEWLLVRKASGAASLLGSAIADEEDETVKVDAALHARALAVRRLLGHELFRPSPSSSHSSASNAEDEEGREQAKLEDAREALIDALTGVARRAAGLKGGLWDEEDSGVDV